MVVVWFSLSSHQVFLMERLCQRIGRESEQKIEMRRGMEMEMKGGDIWRNVEDTRG